MTIRYQSSLLPILFLMVDSTDHITGKTGETVTVTISKNGAAFGAPAGVGTLAELTVGWYQFTPTAADTGTVGTLIVHATAANSDDHDTVFEILAALAEVGADGDTLETLSDQLDGVSAKTDLLGTGVVTFSGPVLPSGDIITVQGDDYLESDGRGLSFTDTSWPDLSTATDIKLSFRLSGDPDSAVTTITGSADGVDTIKFDLTAAVTELFVAGTDVYSFDAQATLASTSIVTLIDPASSRMTVTRQITP